MKNLSPIYPLLICLLWISSKPLFCQKIRLCLGRQVVASATLVTAAQKNQLITSLTGTVDTSLHSYWTARTWKLSDQRILTEFFSGEAVVFANVHDFSKAQVFRFVKNTIPFLKKNISYKAELDYTTGMQLLSRNNAKKLRRFKSGAPELFSFEVYELNNGQIAYLDKSTRTKSITLYENLKALCSENSSIAEEFYAGQSEKKQMKQLAKGDPLTDYEPNEHFLYPEYLKRLIKSHKLKLTETKIPIGRSAYASLFRSSRGYYMLIDDFSQKNASGTAPITMGAVRIYTSEDELKEARESYANAASGTVIYEHFFQNISNQYGSAFGRQAPQIANSLIATLNLGLQELTYSHSEIELIDEAIKWNAASGLSFNKWFPLALAYYGEFYMHHLNNGCWDMRYDYMNAVWIPEVMLNDKRDAFDVFEFYKNMLEGPIPLKLAGDYDGFARRLKNKR